MKIYRRISGVLCGMALIAGVAFAQDKDGKANTGMAVEESYLQESVELMIIREQSRGESLDMKLVALDYIKDAIDRGNTGEEVREALDYLGTEGIVNQTRENGRLVNNFPQVRLRAATYLGELGTTEAKDSLIKMCLADSEPMVLTEVIRSLGKLGINNDEETTNAISWVVTRFDVLNPDNALALSALEAFEKLANAAGGIKNPSIIQTISRIAENYKYIKPVRDRAAQLLKNLRKFG